jgi:hypothetical protein
MIIGYLLVCLSANCEVWTDNFDTMAACETAGAEAIVTLPKLYPQITRVDFRCKPNGVPVKETY